MNRIKISRLVGNIEVIGKDIPNKQFCEGFEVLEMINPKTVGAWSAIGTCVMSEILFNENWYNMLNWKAFLSEYENEITEIIDYFKTQFPEYFLQISPLYNLFH